MISKKKSAFVLALVLMSSFIALPASAQRYDCYGQLQSDIQACTDFDTGILVVLLPLCYAAATANFAACIASNGVAGNQP
jgi:hypothetical protein